MSVAGLTLGHLLVPSQDIFKAAKDGNLNAVEAYLSRGGWADFPSRKGCSLIDKAARAGQTAVVQRLVEAGAHLYHPDRETARREITLTSEISDLLAPLTRSDLHELVMGKFSTMEPAEKYLFLSSLPDTPKCRSAREACWKSDAIENPQAALVGIQQISNPILKGEIARHVVEVFLSFGDAEAAKNLLSAAGLGKNDRDFIALHLDAFDQALKGMENSEDLFQLYLKQSVEQLHAKYRLERVPEQQVLEKLSSCRTLMEMMSASKTFNDPLHRCFVRMLIIGMGGDNLSEQARARAEEITLKNIEAFNAVMGQEAENLERLFKNCHGNDYSAVVQWIEAVKNEATRATAVFIAAGAIQERAHLKEAKGLLQKALDQGWFASEECDLVLLTPLKEALEIARSREGDVLDRILLILNLSSDE